MKFNMEQYIAKADIQSFCRQNHIRKLALFGSALRDELKPDSIIYSSLFGKADTPDDIFKILKIMKAQGLLPNKFTTDLLIKKIKQNPKQTLEKLFIAFTPADIFKDLLLNRFINEACRVDNSGLEYVIPYVEIIGQQKDSVIIYYARLFEYNGAGDKALQILENIKNPNFDFYNIKANCFKTSDFSQALELYKKALEISAEKDPGQKAIAWNNLAQLIFDHKQAALYDEAVTYCREALKTRSYHQFPYPGDLLILFTVLQSSSESLKENIEQILKTYHINKNALAPLVEKIDSPEKKEIIKQF
ncbi:MAG: tetratricopeptide repeat protein [Acidobacteria bacterium]|nr:tetratricopeptide repeat protein [Acidobacteriota bacterium]